MDIKPEALTDEMMETVTGGNCVAMKSDLEGHFGSKIDLLFLESHVGSKVIVKTRSKSGLYLVGTIESVNKIPSATGDLFGINWSSLTLVIRSEDGYTASITNDAKGKAIDAIWLYV